MGSVLAPGELEHWRGIGAGGARLLRADWFLAELGAEQIEQALGYEQEVEFGPFGPFGPVGLKEARPRIKRIRRDLASLDKAYRALGFSGWFSGRFSVFGLDRFRLGSGLS